MVCFICACSWAQAPQASPQVSPQTPPKVAPGSPPSPAAAVPADQQNAMKAREIVEQGIKALGGENYLNIHDREQQGRVYGFHHGRASGGGTLFWSFFEYPDKERVELTRERDIAELYVGDKAWEITYKGPHPQEEKDRADYARRHHLSIDTILRTWVKDPTVVMLFEGNAIAAQHTSYQVTLINSHDESVTLYFDIDSHLPVKKSFEWRDPVDRQKNLEEEVYENYRLVSGIMTPYNITRFFNGDMSNQRFLNSVTFNQPLDEAMFDPNSGYDPNKPDKSKKKH